MLLRSVSGLAYSAYVFLTVNRLLRIDAYSVRLPDNFLEFFVGQAVKNGIDIIRVFDGLNDIVSLEIAIAACLRVGAVVDGSLLYTGDLLDPTSKYSLQYYLDLIDRLVATGAHIVSVKSMTGVMKPEAGRVLVRSIRSRHPDIPIHMHIHDATGMCQAINCSLTMSRMFTDDRYGSGNYASVCRSRCRCYRLRY